MKNLYPFLFICIFALPAVHTVAQPICGFDAAHAKMMMKDPQYKRNVEATNISIRNYIQLHPELLIRRSDRKTIAGGRAYTLSSAYQIPVVVHVIHTGGEIGTIYNPGDAQILGAISYLNQVYNGTWPGTVTTGYGAGDLGIQFVLARRDPNCNPTNGINRVDGSAVAGYSAGGIERINTSGGADEVDIKNLSRWDNTQYYNIWIVNKIDGNDGTSGQFIAGYAYFPGASSNVDGIIMLATQMVAGQKTLPHEIGHAFNLQHPFNPSVLKNTCALNNDCLNQGDFVCDTDPIDENVSSTGVVDFTCRTGLPNPCNGNNPFTDATESNYMNYTNCYTLFTPGQAARMQAAAVGTFRSSLTTSLGGTTPGPGCTPKIDFELQGDQQTETTGGSFNCRNYKDYTYNMVIGVAPSAAATATLTVSNGTAVQGRDFDLTTNGSFTSPSQQLTFAAGSTTTQAFTVRVYDDNSVNGARTATLGFTVNNGGGNAVAGDGRTNFSLIIDDNDVSPTIGSSPYGATGVLGAATNIGAVGAAPFDASQTSQRTQFLYKASELTAAGIPAGIISGLSVNITKQSTRPYANLYIKLGKSASQYLYNSPFITEGSSMTVVKTLPSYATKAGWNTFNFDVPYTWDGTSSLVVEICYDNTTAAPSDASDGLAFYLDGGSTNQANFFWQDDVNCWENFSNLTGAYVQGAKPQVIFNYGISPTVIQTALNSSQSQYLGPNADVYFYDQANGQLMARIQNGSSFDYGCTQVVIDRAGTGSTPFWNNNTTNYLMDKTFHVLPTTNNSSGNYNITLYYTQGEVQGWQNATGQTLSAIQLVKVPGQIFSVTPTNPTGAGTVTIVTPTVSTLGVNTGLTYNFTNGFSGFGAGVPSLTDLPITLLKFTGRLENNNAVLSWTTSFEQNSAGFEIDRSFDGQHFSKIGYLPAAGNSTTQKDYSYTDLSLTADSNFYQLKEISLDGTATYSKVVLVRDPHATPGFTVLPNPFTTDLDLVFGHVPIGRVELRLLDITGRELWRQLGTESDGSHLHLDLAAARLTAGVYLLEVRTPTGIETQRVIKK